MTSRRYIPESGIVFFAERATLQEKSLVRRDDPDVRRAMPVAVAMDFALRLANPSQSPFGGQNVDQLDQSSLLFKNFLSSASRASVSPLSSPRRAAVRQNDGSRSVTTSMELAFSTSFVGQVPRTSS